MLKTDLHIHTKEDMHEHLVWSSAKKLINFAAKKGFNVLSITHHDNLFFNKEIKDYAKKKGILLIPGIEMTLEGRHVLVYGVTNKEIKKIKKIKDLWKIKNNKHLIIAPHPFFPGNNTLQQKLIENIDLFDAIEYSHFYFNSINFNKKAEQVAKKYHKPLVGTSDVHNLMQMNYTYTYVDGEKTTESIMNAIRKNKIKLVTEPFPKIRIGLTLLRMWAERVIHFFEFLFKKIKQI